MNITGLLDTGASISLLGKGCRELLENLGLNCKPIFSIVSTASGKEHRLIGKMDLEIEFNEVTKNILFYLCPDLEQEAYLEILSRIDETFYISSVDLKFAFWQIELEEESKPYTAFTVTGWPLYQFRVMPFWSLQCGPTILQSNGQSHTTAA